MDVANAILTLSAVDKYKLAEEAFHLPHNRSRYLGPLTHLDDGPSRETTPHVNDQIEEELPTQGGQIRLDFDQETKVPGRFTFGTDPSLCDVLLGRTRRQHHISGQHFHITFDAEKRVILQDVSTNGTTVSYDRQGEKQKRHNFTWILFDKFKKITVELQNLAFDVHLVDHRLCEDEYEAHIDNFTNTGRDALPRLDLFAFRSHETSIAPSESLSPRQRPIYLTESELGRGSFGRVCKVVDVSTGWEYAGKEFFRREGWEHEVDIMRGLHHEHIVQFIDLSTESTPLLVMEYLPLGNVEDQHADSPIAVEEATILMYQSLQALSYLHDHKVTHRDIKPANILVSSRHPFVTKLADFGLAKDKSILQTCCGTLAYAAPEIFQGQDYSNAVDQWSLGVVVMEYVYGLPRLKKQPRAANPGGNGKARGLSWCRRLIAAVADWDSDALIDFLAASMLKYDPRERLPAAACLKKASEIGLFSGLFQETGSSTPKIGQECAALVSKEEAPTFILGPLWQDQTRLQGSQRSNRVVSSYSFAPTPNNEKAGSCSVRTTRSRGELGRTRSDQATFKRSVKRQRIATQYGGGAGELDVSRAREGPSHLLNAISHTDAVSA